MAETTKKTTGGRIKKKTTKTNIMTTQNFMKDSPAEEEVMKEIEEVSIDEESKPEPKTLPVAGKLVAKQKHHEIVTITVFEDMDPAPVIGNYDFRHEKRVSVLTKGKHEVPRFVAEVLVDKNKATM